MISIYNRSLLHRTLTFLSTLHYIGFYRVFQLLTQEKAGQNGRPAHKILLLTIYIYHP